MKKTILIIACSIGALAGLFGLLVLTGEMNSIITTFKLEQNTLTTTVEPIGGGSITKSFSDDEAIITISASPGNDYLFDHWSGDVESYDNPVQKITRDKPKTITAHFRKIETLETNLTNGQTDNLLTYEIKGAGLQGVNLTIVSKVEKILKVNIKQGMIFQTSPIWGNKYQKMVTLNPTTITLNMYEKNSLYINVACINMHLEAPTHSQELYITDETAEIDLHTLIESNLFQKKDFRIKQFAIWTITDNPERHGFVGLGGFGSGSSPGDKEIAEIKELFEMSGISSTKYNAFK